MPDDLSRLTAGWELADKNYVRRKVGGLWEVNVWGTFGPGFGARISKQLRLRGCRASYNFLKPASVVD